MGKVIIYIMEEYIIVNKTAIQRRIAELEQDTKDLAYSDEANPYGLGYLSGNIEELKQILSQSVPLIPEIEKAFGAGCRCEDWIDGRQNYISQLKLDI